MQADRLLAERLQREFKAERTRIEWESAEQERLSLELITRLQREDAAPPAPPPAVEGEVDPTSLGGRSGGGAGAVPGAATLGDGAGGAGGAGTSSSSVFTLESDSDESPIVEVIDLLSDEED
mmetsp:Transcript_34256/g.89883  ORF Transcript_34256/g.89883 Transcript_34256/m.89883 type:complete len:122 (+) Transcript_34256:50-415(+)